MELEKSRSFSDWEIVQNRVENISKKSKYQVQKKDSEREKSEKSKRFIGRALNSELVKQPAHLEVW